MDSGRFSRQAVIAGLFAVALFVVPASVLAQIRGIKGVVTDDRGQLIPGASIVAEVISVSPSSDDFSVRVIDRGQKYQTRSSDNGDYFLGVPHSGIYLVSATKDGVGTISLQVDFNFGTVMTANLTLRKTSSASAAKNDCNQRAAIGAFRRSGLGGAAPPALTRLLGWLEAVHLHAPGCLDPAAREVGSWSQQELESLLRDVRELVRFLQRAKEQRSEYGATASAQRDQAIFAIHNRRFTIDELERTLYGGEKLAANEMLRRGAVLHADVAEFVAGRLSAAPLVDDGGRKGWRPGTLHWEVGRQLLDSILPQPNDDSGALLWYRAVSAYLFREGRLDEVSVHLDKARRVFPGQAIFLLESAYLHEELSSPAIQAAIQTVRADGIDVAVRARRTEFEIVERFLRQVLALSSDDTDARLRLGRTLSELGRHEEASTELRAVVNAKPSQQRLYLAELFLGRSEQALGKRDEAERRFQNASVLYPNAQSPRLALGQLARQHGDISNAQQAIRDLATFSKPNTEADPWWSYYHPHGADAEMLIGEMRKLGTAEVP